MTTKSTSETRPTTRICSRCGQRKSLDNEFYRATRGTHGRQGFCKTCSHKELVKYRQTDKGKAKYLLYAKRHREKDGYTEKHRSYRMKPRPIWNSYRQGAEKRGLEFTFTLEEFTERFWQKPCDYCGDNNQTAGVDRVDNTVGYTQTNTAPCCSVCNFMKLDSARGDFIAKCKQIAHHQLQRGQRLLANPEGTY